MPIPSQERRKKKQEKIYRTAPNQTKKTPRQKVEGGGNAYLRHPANFWGATSTKQKMHATRQHPTCDVSKPKNASVTGKTNHAPGDINAKGHKGDHPTFSPKSYSNGQKEKKAQRNARGRAEDVI